MAIHVQHTYSTHVIITYTAADGAELNEAAVGSMDELLENVCDVLVHHNFNHADVCDASTGEVLMIVDRT